VRTGLLATGLSASGYAVEALVALPAHRREGLSDPAAWLPGAYASSRASPEATRRQPWAV
jgi:hypothetical protein